jgi:branched-chain amino acid transport system ATP-binding protein
VAEVPTTGEGPLLAVTDLGVAYDKVEVVHGVSLRVEPGEFVVMLGRNGAGKTTTLHAISGLIPKRGGSVVFDGQAIAQARPRDIVRSGLVQVLQGHRVFTGLTVEDNLILSAAMSGRGGAPSELAPIYEAFPEMAERRDQPASRLSGGQQQILAIAQGLAAKPRLLLLDEPSGGVAPLVVNRILEIAKALTREGTAVLLVEQLVEKALAYADRCDLLDNGRIAGSGTPAEIEASGLLRDVYLGRARTPSPPHRGAPA